MLEYHGKLVLAPMVRVGELPVRLLSLKYGADLVWGPEIVDKKIIQCQRVYNERLKTVDFVEKANNSRVVFRTYPTLEKNKLVFQLGTASPDLAVEAAKVVAQDVDAIDVNSGCPKHFSIHSGMGSALLWMPDKLESILKALVKEVGQPNNISISVKIRLLETHEKTCELVQRLVKTGINLLTVHCRTIPMRPRQPAIRDSLAEIARICREADVACFVNGDVNGRWEFRDLLERYNLDGAMIARGAESNTSCFLHDISGPAGLIPWLTVSREYVKICGQFDNHVANTKYCLLRMIPGKSLVYQVVSRAKTREEIERVLQSIEVVNIENSKADIVVESTKETDDLAKVTDVPSKRPLDYLESAMDQAAKRAILI